MKLFTIGFTKKSAEDFFNRIKNAGVLRVVDVRLNNTSQIAGFAKGSDLPYFLKTIAGIEYIHVPDFAPTQEILDDFKKKKGPWAEYERRYRDLLSKRKIADKAPEILKDKDCLLCSENTPEYCHRRLLAEHIQEHLTDVEIVHL